MRWSFFSLRGCYRSVLAQEPILFDHGFGVKRFWGYEHSGRLVFRKVRGACFSGFSGNKLGLDQFCYQLAQQVFKGEFVANGLCRNQERCWTNDLKLGIK